MSCPACLQPGHRAGACPHVRSGRGTTEACFRIPRGEDFVSVGRRPLYFEIQFFKWAAAPQYYVTYLYDSRPEWTCTCPDFRFRRHGDRRMCKHIQACVHLLQGRQLPGGNYAEFLRWHIRRINQEAWQRYMSTPIGQPLPIIAIPTRMRVQYPNDTPGYIDYDGRQWACRTCGGPDGRRFLKQRQCKHIACYTANLPYCHPMVPTLYTRAWQRQRRLRRAAWQRFT